MAKIQGVVFDADGTLFDTASLIYDAYHHIALTHGYKQPTRHDVAKEMGKPIPEILEGLFPGADIATMLQTNTDFVMHKAAEVVAFDGLEQLVKELHSHGLKLGILTSGGEKIYTMLEAYGLSLYFESVVHAGHVRQHKPHPEGLELVATQLGLPVGQLIVVGDSSQDIQVAKNGGAAASVGVTHGFSTREALQQFGADYVIDSLLELPEIIDSVEKT